MKRILLLTAALMVAGTMASAAITAQSLISDLSAQGYSRIEVKTGLTQIKVEAIKGTTKLETIYDIASGQVLKSETGTVGLFDDTATGVELSDRNRDFLRLASNDGASNDDNSNDGASNDDNSNDDNSNDDNSNDGDSNDDNSNDGDSNDDNSDSDQGSDDSDHGSDNSGHGSDD